MHTGYVAVIAFFGGCIVTRQLFCSNTAVTGPGVDPQEGVYRQYQVRGNPPPPQVEGWLLSDPHHERDYMHTSGPLEMVWNARRAFAFCIV